MLIMSFGEFEVTEFDVARRAIHTFLQRWKGASPDQIPARELAAVEELLAKMSNEYAKAASNHDACQQEVSKLRGEVAMLRATLHRHAEKAAEDGARIEKLELQAEELELQAGADRRILHALEAKMIEKNRLILMRQMAYAIQFAMARKFPTIFTTKVWEITYSRLRSEVRKVGTKEDQQTLRMLEKEFNNLGFSVREINSYLHELRRMGFGISHPTSLDNIKDVDIAAMQEIIAQSTSLYPELKEFAAKAMHALNKFQGDGLPLLASSYAAEK